jgi:hypothetical protein
MIKYQQGDVLFKKLNDTEIKVIEKKHYNNSDVASTIEVGERLIIQPPFRYEPNSKIRLDIQERASNYISGNKSLTVAFGEATGHSHTFYMNTQIDDVVIGSYGKQRHRNIGDIPQIIGISKNNAIIEHQEHNPLSLPTGYYQISIVREFDHISNVVRGVID